MKVVGQPGKQRRGVFNGNDKKCREEDTKIVSFLAVILTCLRQQLDEIELKSSRKVPDVLPHAEYKHMKLGLSLKKLHRHERLSSIGSYLSAKRLVLDIWSAGVAIYTRKIS